MPALLFVDVLGARRRWESGGIEEAVSLFDRFTRIVIAACRPDVLAIHAAGIETDSAAIVCETGLAALAIARRMFTRAHAGNALNPNDRLWMRGAVVSCDHAVALRTSRAANGAASRIEIVRYSEALYSAIAIEKSGFKGMRLLVSPTAISKSDRAELAIRAGERMVIPLKRLKNSAYPKGPSDTLEDFLWMYGDGSKDEWRRHSIAMSKRLRVSAKDPEEFAQAAATQVVFHEADAIMRAQLSRSHRARLRRK